MSKLIREYVLIAKDEYEALTKLQGRSAVDAVTHARDSLARDLLAARKQANLTQTELAKRLRISQSLVSQAEQGKVKVGERYVTSLLKACGLPRHWAPKPTRSKMTYPRKGEAVAADVITLREGTATVRFERSSAAFAAKSPPAAPATKRARRPKARRA